MAEVFLIAVTRVPGRSPISWSLSVSVVSVKYSLIRAVSPTMSSDSFLTVLVVVFIDKPLYSIETEFQ